MYVGCASNIRTRWNGHLHNLRQGNHPNSYLQNSWSKYGEPNFKFEIIEYCDVIRLHEREHYWVSVLDSLDKNKGYNLKPTDPSGCSTHSDETKEKLRIANKGKKPSELCIQKLKERTLSKEHKELLVESRKLINFKELHREKRGKKIINTKTNVVYGSLAELCEILNITKSSLSRKLAGKRFNNTNFKYI
jgi:group I intron endonuclease